MNGRSYFKQLTQIGVRIIGNKNNEISLSNDNLASFEFYYLLHD